jgi:NADH:ubiquinone oxidoreductase subunit 5 (subunit L)/multisubunit Na+/H+ antiporter MnhA subunit
MVNEFVLLLSLFSPALAALLIYFRDFKRKDQMIMAVTSLIISFLLINSKLPAVMSLGFIDEEHLWISNPEIAFDMHLDGLSFVLSLLILLLGSCSLIFSESYISKKSSKFNSLMLLFIA